MGKITLRERLLYFLGGGALFGIAIITLAVLGFPLKGFEWLLTPVLASLVWAGISLMYAGVAHDVDSFVRY